MTPPPADRELEPATAAPRQTTYTGERIALEPLDAERHTADLFAASHGSPESEAIWDWMPDGPFADRDSMSARLHERAMSPDLLAFAVVDRTTNRAIGMACYLGVEPAARRLEVGFIWYALSHRGGSANNEVMLLMLGEAFEHLGYRRVEWKCDALNERSRRAALRLGFKYEGIFRQHMIVKGKNRDTAYFSMLDSEWPQTRAALEHACSG
jgi:RimJ/RimL family protein N-acetyltransferase